MADNVDIENKNNDSCCSTSLPGERGGGPGAHSYDLAVIGAGSAGFSAAITAANLGARVALIGDGTVGGTCVNVGCVPSKNLIRAAGAVHEGHAAARFAGIDGQAALKDWPALIASKDELVGAMRQKKYIDLLPTYEGVEYIEQGRARLVTGGVAVGDRVIKAKKTIIVTGARPRIPAISGIESVPYLTSTSALALKQQPATMMVVGGGYIGCELAQAFARLGTKVTIVTRSRLLPRAEPEISAGLTKYLTQEGIEIVEGVKYHAISGDRSGVSLEIEQDGAQRAIEADRVLVTTGRTPNTEGLGLKDMGVKTDANGAIVVDELMRTSLEGVFAAGDVTGRDQFVYMAAYGAKLAARNAFEGAAQRYDNTTMPWVVFTDPQIAGVGLSEAGARAAGHKVKISVLDLAEVPRALAARDTRGLIKLVADADSDRLLGGQIMAPEGSDSVQTLVMALKMGMTAKQLGETIFPYLTTVEGLKLAAQTFDMDVAKLSCCAG